jgi:hypothetical protein
MQRGLKERQPCQTQTYGAAREDENLNLSNLLGSSWGAGAAGKPLVLDILVEAVGRQNFGCDTGGWDFKGLQSPDVQLNGGWARPFRPAFSLPKLCSESLRR